MNQAQEKSRLSGEGITGRNPPVNLQNVQAGQQTNPTLQALQTDVNVAGPGSAVQEIALSKRV